jgi:hypothetical protein
MTPQHTRVPGGKSSTTCAAVDEDRRANIQMEPTRQTACAILSPQRAARLDRQAAGVLWRYDHSEGVMGLVRAWTRRGVRTDR